LHFENEIEHKILVTYVIAKVSVCLFDEFDGFPPASALRFYIYFFPYFLYNLGLTLFEEVV